MHCEPNASADFLIRFGSLTAAVFIDTLSAPESSTSLISLIESIPPPTVKGMNNVSAVLLTVSSRIFRFS